MPDPELLPPPPPKKNVTTSELLPPPPKKKDYGGGDLGNGGSVFSDPFAFLIKEQPELHPKPQKVSGKTAPQEPTPFVKAVSFDKFLNKTIRINDNEEISIDPRTIPISPVISDNGDMFVYKVSKKVSEGKPLNDIEKKFINANKSPILSLSAYDIQSLDDFVTKNDISSAVLPESATALVPSMAGKTVGEASGSPEGRYAQVRALKEKLSENLLFLQKNLVFSPSDDKMKSMKTIMDELSELDNIETKLARQFTIVSDKGATALVSTDESGNSWNRFLGFIKNYGTLPSMLISDKNENVINKVNELPSEFMTGLNYVRFKEPVEFERVSRLLAEGKPISESQVAVLTNYGIDIERQKLKDQYADGKIDEAQYNVQNKELGNKAYENLLGNKEAGRAFFSSNIAEVLDLMNIEQPNITGTYTDYIFGHRWNYTAEEIEDAAKVVARVNNIDTSDARYKDIVKWLQDNEGAMIGKNSIYKAGWTRDLARGIIQPLSGVSKFIEAPFKTDEQQYAEGKSQGNVNITDIPVKRIADGWQGTVGKVLEGTGQLVSQIGLSYALAGGSMALGTAILGRAGTAALAGDIALADMSAGQIVGKTLLGSKDAIATYAMSYASTYDGYKKTAMNYTSDDATATAVAGGMAGLEGITENFLSPLDIARGVGKKIFGNPSFAKEAINIIDGVAVVNKEAAIKNIILKAVKESGNVILSEIGEEEVTQLADFGVNAMLNPNSQSFKDRNLWQEIGETAYQTGLSMVIPALASGVSAYNANNFAKGSLLIAAQNTQRFVDNLKLRLADNEIDQEQYNNFTQLINTAKVVNETLPQKVDGQKLNSNEKADYIFSRVSEAVLEKQKEKSKDAAEVNVLNQKIKEQQDFRTKILKNEGTKNAENNGNNQNAEGSQTDNTDNSQNTKVATSAENIKFEDKVRQVYPTLKNATDEEVNSFVTENAMDNPVQVLDKLGEDSFNEVIAKVPTEELQAKLDFLLSTDTENPNVEVLDGIIASREKEYTTPAVPLSEGNSALRGKIETLNPTGSIFSDYTAEQRDKLPLGENITTYDKTAQVNPEEKVIVYRGVPNDVDEIKSGDFVTTNKQLAKDYAGTGKVISKEVSAKEILDDKTEPMGEEYILRETKKSKVEGNSALRDVENKINDVADEYLFHGTGEGAFRRIREEGMKSKSGGYLYFADTEQYATTYAQRKGNSFGDRVLRVKKSDAYEGDINTGLKGDFKIKGDIKPEDIEINDKGKWVPIQEYSDERIGILPLSKPTTNETTPTTGTKGVEGVSSDGGGNKAVTKDGEPIEMYHGSGTSKTFDDFNENSFFTPNDYIAENYAENQGGKVHKVFIYTKKPLEIKEDKSRMQRSGSGFLMTGTDGSLITLFDKLYGKDAVRLYKEYGLSKGLGNIIQGNFEPLIKYAKEKGYDSLKFKDSSFDNLITDDTFLVFDPKNVSKDKNYIKNKNLTRESKPTISTEQTDPTTKEVEGVSSNSNEDNSALRDVETKQQIENFGVNKTDVEPVHNVISQVFDGLKKAGLTAAKTVGEWVGIGKGSEKPYSLKIDGKDVKVKPTSPDVVNGFYSPLEKIINETKFDKLPAKQWAEKYANSEEAKWTGLKDWLVQQQGSVSKADIQQFLKDNRIQVVEVVKSNDEKAFTDKKIKDAVYTDSKEWIELGNGIKTKADVGGFVWLDMNGIKERLPYIQAENYIHEGLKTTHSETKFGNYQLAGEKENYKEVLVTLPDEAKLGREKNSERTNNLSREIKNRLGIEEGTVKSNTFNILDYLDKGLLTEKEKKEWQSIRDEKIPSNFKSSHFDEPNILVHLRMNTRTDAEGNKVLFLEEVQSDWGQKGKKEGFKETSFVVTTRNDFGLMTDEFKTRKEAEEFVAKMGRDNVSSAGIREINKGDAPSAPFVTDTNSWTKLGLKVALKEAVKQGADKIAWTTGEQQNSRYDLSKQVDAIQYVKHGDTFDISAIKDGSDVFNKTGVSLKELEGIVGKDVANKIANNEGESTKKTAPISKASYELKTLKGDDLKVGGTGMKGFYGSPTEGKLGIIGNVAKSLFKQEPKTVDIKTNKEVGYELGEANFVGGTGVYHNGDLWAEFDTKKEAQDYIDKYNKSQSTQHSIDITPELKASVEGGQPLFKDAEAQYRIESGKNIVEAIKDFNGSPRATVALTHEIMHPTVVAIIDGAKEGNEVGTKHTETIVNEFNKANPNSKVTVEDLINGNDAFKNGTTSKQYRQVQEFIAKAWEKYHREGGKGFSAEFQKVLDQITKVFQSVYKSLTGEQLTPELRKMFDEILGKEALSKPNTNEPAPTKEVITPETKKEEGNSELRDVKSTATPKAEERTFTKNALDRADAKKIYQQVREVDVPTDAEQIALEYIAIGGKVSESSINEVAGSVKRATLNTGRRDLKSSEAKTRDYSDKNAKSFDGIAHELWGIFEQRVSETDIKNALMDAVRDNTTRLDAAKSYLERYSPEYIEAKQQEKFYQEHLEEIEAEEKAINEWLNSENEIATEAIADINYVNSLISKYETENKGQDKQPATATESKTDKGVSNDASTQKTEKQKRIDDFNKKADKIANDLIDFLTPKSTRGAKTSGMGIADIINGATTAIKAAYAVSQNIKEAVDAGIKYFKDNWNTDELGELPEDALREKLTNDFEVPVEQIAKSVAKEIRDGNISYNDAKEGKSKEFIDELNKELFGSKKFNFDEDAFKEQIRKQKAIGITEEEVVELLSSSKKITKAQRAIISEVFGESAETDKLAADLKEAFNNLAKGEKPKMVLNRLSKSNITKLVDALRETLTYTPVSNKQLSKMADNIVESMDLNQAEDYLNAMINNSVLGLRQVLRAKLIVALGNEGKNELATNLVRDMADEAIQTGRHSQSLVLAYEILGAKANPAIRAEFERERVEVLQQKAAQMTHNYAKAISEQEVEIGKLNEKIHNMTQKSSAMNKIKEVINRLCGLRNKK